ncbi:unnamed protein product [Spirodela intermedia]|uniref:Uncharacterized protein n=1 Tax=Spirodela intermedia TaxID=51605 RepID=A0A7I8JDE5_SPIIN|nr:unnamed protein product [Spirodela intermedia]CAA6668170.1 unnamed protein product [Spirodela intermedia]
MRNQNGNAIVEDGEGSLKLQMPEPVVGAIGGEVQQRLRQKWSRSSTAFEPQREEQDDSIIAGGSGRDGGSSSFFQAPEKKLTLFALRLAILEKVASRLGALGFVWATVVLLGGFAITLSNTDFWVVTVILLVESARIFSRSHELEWQHQSTWSFAELRRNSFRLLRSPSFAFLRRMNPSSALSDARSVVASSGRRRTWESGEVPLLPYARWFFLSSKQQGSLLRLISQDYGEIEKCDTDKRNRKAALFLFYGTALAEAALFLAEKAYWEWKISFCKLLERVSKECGFGPAGSLYVRRFFYDAYSMCINGSIFDGLKMDLVSFAEELLVSDSGNEQLMGAQIIKTFAKSEKFAGETLRKMLNWKNPAEAKIRLSAAEIVSKLAGKNQKALRLAGIPGAMESIASLLHTSQFSCVEELTDDYFSALNLLGLLILKKVTRDHGNCGKIGNTHGLLSKIIDFTGDGEKMLRNGYLTDAQVTAFRRSLQLVKRLARATGPTGEQLRREISENVFSISNIREILQYGENNKVLQNLGIDILTSLAMDEEARERIGGTGGVIQQFVVDPLVAALKDPVLQVNSLRIMRNLCAYGDATSYNQLYGVSAAAIPTVLNAAAMADEEKLLEVSIGLATQILRFTSTEELARGFRMAAVTEDKLAEKLVSTLERYERPSVNVPRMRRFAIELAIQMMRSSPETILRFERYGMMSQLQRVVETTSELESFRVFSGSVGVNRHAASVVSLAETAMSFLHRDQSVELAGASFGE